MLESLLPSKVEQVECAVDAVMRNGQRKTAQIGLSFKESLNKSSSQRSEEARPG
jgi:hypothetical protein